MRGALIDSEILCCEDRERFAVTVVDEIFEMAKAQIACMRFIEHLRKSSLRSLEMIASKQKGIISNTHTSAHL